MTTILTGILLALLTALLFALFFRPAKRKAGEQAAASSPLPQNSTRTCPLCGSRLEKGQTVKSVVYATKTTDKIMEISGCPHCWQVAGGKKAVSRFCPVCKKELREAEVVTARVFERKDTAKKTHVHVLGCPRCRER